MSTTQSCADAASDRELVTGFLTTRSEARFLEIYRRHNPRLLRICVRFLPGGMAGADDSLQETWLRAVKALPGFEWRCALSTWLTGIALRVCLETERRNGIGTGRVVSLDADLDVGADPSASFDLTAAIDAVRVLAQLPAGYRAALILHDVEGFTHEEVADSLDIAVGTAKSQLARARRAARALLPDFNSPVPMELKQ